MSFQEINLKSEYRSGVDNLIKNFYNPVLKKSVCYKRAVGFFSSTALISLSEGLRQLLENGGKIQIIASPKLSQEDIAAINDGLRRRSNFTGNNLSSNYAGFSEKRLNLLSDLIAAQKLEIKLAVLERDQGLGMFHEKLGLMYDGRGNCIAFSGSMNESTNAFLSNYEAIDIFTSWTTDAVRVQKKESAFKKMWLDCAPGIRVMNFDSVDFKISTSSKTSERLIQRFTLRVPGIQIPEGVKLRSYQLNAIESWAQNSFVGIFDMATGSGKTFTALAALSKLFKKLEGNLAIFIVCPYQHLVLQWQKNISEFGMKSILCYSGSPQRDWLRRLKNSVIGFNLKVIKSFCAVLTNQTFAGSEVQKLVKSLNENAVLVVDEAHNFGAEKFSQALPENFQYRLALSATIERHGDLKGTTKLFGYFEKKCITLNLKTAIKNGVLAPYYYYPIQVVLDSEELERYLKLTAKIGKAFHSANEENTEHVKMLLIKRASIITGAKEKIEKFRRLIANYREDNQLLIYCGSAKINNQRQIDLVAKILGQDLGMRIKKFTCRESSKERANITSIFEEGKYLQALVAIRCLDEGVDFPAVKTAFILASSTNPREYIQRRGRVLRKSPAKKQAVIFDFITLPIPLNEVKNYDTCTIESVKALVQKEILRVRDFSEVAENPYDSSFLIQSIQEKYMIKEAPWNV